MSRTELSHFVKPVNLDAITAVAICGGGGVRLGASIPKPLVQVFGKPLIDYTIDPLKASGVKNYLFLAAQNSTEIEGHVKEALPDAVTVVSSNRRNSGIAQELRDALLDHDVRGPIALFLADDVREGLNIEDAINFHQESKAQLTLVGRTTKKYRPTSVILHDENNQITELIRNKDRVPMPGSTASCGVTICSDSATNLIRGLADDEIESSGSLHPLKKYLMDRLTRVQVFVPTAKMAFVNVNTPRDVLKAERLLAVFSRH